MHYGLFMTPDKALYFLIKRIRMKKILVIASIAYESRFHIMVHVKWPSPSFKVDLDHENDNIMKNGFYQRILQPSEHPKRVGAKKFYFFKTLLDGPLPHQFTSLFYPE